MNKKVVDEAAAKNIPADEATDSSVRGSYNRAKSQVKGDLVVKKLKEIWTPEEIKTMKSGGVPGEGLKNKSGYYKMERAARSGMK